MSPCSFVPDPVPRFSGDLPDGAMIFVFRGKELLLTGEGTIPRKPELSPSSALRIGSLGDIPCFGAEASACGEIQGTLEYRESRPVMHAMDEGMRYAASRARELVLWRKAHTFCGKCGAVLKESEHDEGMICPACGAIYFPQIAPAVITAVMDGNRILLAHNRNFKGNIHSLIAGFVESGETAEQAVVREIREEVGVEVKNVRYLYSQSWPFPNSLMLGFAAEYESGTPTPDGTEIDHADWFTKENLPEIPQKGSIARRILDEIFDL